MQGVFEAINGVFGFIGPLSDLLWDFPTNCEWYRNIPILGNISLAIIVLLGSGIFFTIKLGFIQVTYFKKGIHLLTEKRSVKTGITPLAAFLLSAAMRVGPGNIIGVTGAIAVGGPGALFWMWISAFFGMAVAYMEAVLAQIFKEKKDDEFVGGLPFYGRKLLGNSVGIGVFLSILYILYALCCLPAQGFNVVSSVGRMAEILTGKTIAADSLFYYVAGALIIILTAVVAFGGIKKVSKWTDMMVPVMAVLYILVVVVLIILNVGQIPYFFTSVFGGAFKPQAFFGGATGTVLAQGVKRLHDLNKSGWLILLCCVPIIGWIFALYMLFADGTVGPNPYGADPKNRMPYQAQPASVNVTVNVSREEVKVDKPVEDAPAPAEAPAEENKEKAE